MLLVYAYDTHNVTFTKADNTVYVNATEMARAFGRHPNMWLNRGATKEFIAELEKKEPTITAPVVEKTSYENVGTWLHKDVAASFAQWLSPLFHVWFNETVNQLLTMNADKEKIIDLTKRVELLEKKVAVLTKDPAKKKPVKAVPKPKKAAK